MSLKFLDPDAHLPEPARSRLEAGLGLLMNAHYDQALGEIRDYVRDENPDVRGFACLFLGDINHFQWEFALCMQSYERAAEAFTEAHNDRGAIMTSMRIADIYVDEAACDKMATAPQVAAAQQRAYEKLDSAAADAARLGDDFLMAFAQHYRALFETADERFKDAALNAQQAAELRDRIGDTIYAPSSWALLARAKGELGDFEHAIEMAERTFQTQMERDLRGPALRTLHIISHVRDLQTLSRTKALAAQFTAVEPIARTPFVFGDRPAEEFEGTVARASMDTPFTGATRRLNGVREELVKDAEFLVSMLQS